MSGHCKSTDVDGPYFAGENGLSDSDSDKEHSISTGSDDNISPYGSDKQYLNQPNDLKAALINSKALVGDYVELKNCKRCGAMIFKVSSR